MRFGLAEPTCVRSACQLQWTGWLPSTSVLGAFFPDIESRIRADAMAADSAFEAPNALPVPLVDSDDVTSACRRELRVRGPVDRQEHQSTLVF